MAALVSYVLTQNSTRSTGPISWGSLVAWTGSENVPARRDFTVRPCVRRASNCVPRARKLTSSPALARSPPKYPPVPPAPMTTIRICSLLQKMVAAIFFISSEQVYLVKSHQSIYFDSNFLDSCLLEKLPSNLLY